MSDNGPRLERIVAFEVDGRVLFKHYFERRDVFTALESFYDGENYRFDAPESDVSTLVSTLEDYGYDLEIADRIEDYAVVKEEYTPYAEILKRSVIHWQRRGYNFFVMQDLASVEFAMRNGAEPIDDVDVVLGI